MEMNNTKINWILLILFCLLTVLFSILLVKVPSTGDKMNTLARVGYWLGVIVSVTQIVFQFFEIRRKKRG